MKLHETIYMKITTGNKVYYLQYKSFANRYDGRIDYREISKKTYDTAKLMGYKIEEKPIGNARPGARHRIRNNEFIGEKINEMS